MKFVKIAILVAVIAFIIAVGINFYKLYQLDKDGEFNRKYIEISIEVAKRLNPGLLGIISSALSGDVFAAVGGEDRLVREYSNVICDWYAPIKWPPILNTSKEIWRLIYKNKFEIKE